jgi:uncharacterized protein YneR
MSDIDMNTIKDKIKKLLSLSTSPSAHEASTALLMAHQLLKKYNLSANDLKTTSVQEEIYLEGSKERVWKSIMLDALCKYNFCIMVKVVSPVDSDYEYKIVGKEHNIISVKVMADYLFSALDRLVSSIERLEKENFRKGFSLAIANRLMEEKAKETECKDLVVLFNEEITDYLKEKQCKAVSVNVKAKQTLATHLGYKQGSEISLNSQVSKENGDLKRLQ